eukprot:g82721.t1
MPRGGGYNWRQHLRGGGGLGGDWRGEGGRSGGGGGGGRGHDRPAQKGTKQDLISILQRIDGRGYGGYKDLIGEFNLGPPHNLTLFVDRVQSDPFAPPSRARIRVPAAVARFPDDMLAPPVRNVALCDFLTRRFWTNCTRGGHDRAAANQGWSGEKGGDIGMAKPGQQVLQRSSVVATKDFVEARFTVALPAQGRNILGRWASEILGSNIPSLTMSSLVYPNLSPADSAELTKHIHTVEDQEALRSLLSKQGLAAFVANGSILPRRSGVDDGPMEEALARKFVSPPSMQVAFNLPHCGEVKGMGIRQGVTLIVGGGFHGKSTLLKALERAVYNHIPGDGRELVAVDPTAVKIRAEDGRQIASVDLSPFINNLPMAKNTKCFDTADASGSTSQAANIMEALELGCSLLLLDEDTCATNFMVRDRRMQQLVAAKQEPITPFLTAVRALYDEAKVSTVIVVGGTGDYFDVADQVLLMDSYLPADVTSQAKEIAAKTQAQSSLAGTRPLHSALKHTARSPLGSGVPTDAKLRVLDRSKIAFGDNELDLRGVEQLRDIAQTRGISEGLVKLALSGMDGKQSLRRLLEALDQELDRNGLDVLTSWRGERHQSGLLARPRKFELAAALNRLRGMKFLSAEETREPAAKKRQQEGGAAVGTGWD